MKAEIITKALGGRQVGGCWMARCPVHDDREPSSSISTGDEGKVLVYCHAGCDQTQVIAALMDCRKSTLEHIWSRAGDLMSKVSSSKTAYQPQFHLNVIPINDAGEQDRPR